MDEEQFTDKEPQITEKAEQSVLEDSFSQPDTRRLLSSRTSKNEIFEEYKMESIKKMLEPFVCLEGEEQNIKIRNLDLISQILQNNLKITFAEFSAYCKERIDSEQISIPFRQFQTFIYFWLNKHKPVTPISKVNQESADLLHQALWDHIRAVKKDFLLLQSEEGAFEKFLQAISDRCSLEFSNILELSKEFQKRVGEPLSKIPLEKCLIKLEDCVLQSRRFRVSIKEQKEEVSKNISELQAQILSTIAQYESLCIKYQSEGKDISTIQRLIEMLQKQIDSPPLPTPEPIPEPTPEPVIQPIIERQEEEEKVYNALKEIFYFYCKQQGNVGRTPTFEIIRRDDCNMHIGEFVKFCKDFKVPIVSQKLNELFKRYSLHGKELPWEYFLTILQKVADQIVIDKIKTLTQELKKVLKKIFRYNPDISLNIDQNESVAEPSPRKIEMAKFDNKINNEIQRIRLIKELKNQKQKDSKQRLQEFINYKKQYIILYLCQNTGYD